MKKFILAIALSFFYISSALATECSIQFGGGGKNSAVYSLKNTKITKTSNLGSPWSFLRYSRGPCKFTLFNKDNYKGRKVQYGETSSTRIASQDGKAKGGWKVRSLIIEPLASNCHIVLKAEQDKGIVDHIKSFDMNSEVRVGGTKGYFTYSGPSNFSNVSELSSIHSTSGDSNCRYTLYNENNFSGRQITVEKVSKPFRGDWRVRSMKITNKVSNSTKLVPGKTRERVKPIRSTRRNETAPAQRGSPNKNKARDHRKTNSRSEIRDHRQSETTVSLKANERLVLANGGYVERLANGAVNIFGMNGRVVRTFRQGNIVKDQSGRVSIITGRQRVQAGMFRAVVATRRNETVPAKRGTPNKNKASIRSK